MVNTQTNEGRQRQGSLIQHRSLVLVFQAVAQRCKQERWTLEFKSQGSPTSPKRLKTIIKFGMDPIITSRENLNSRQLGKVTKFLQQKNECLLTMCIPQPFLLLTISPFYIQMYLSRILNLMGNTGHVPSRSPATSISLQHENCQLHQHMHCTNRASLQCPGLKHKWCWGWLILIPFTTIAVS